MADGEWRMAGDGLAQGFAEGVDAFGQLLTLVIEFLLLLSSDVAAVLGQKGAADDFKGRTNGDIQMVVERFAGTLARALGCSERWS